MSKIDTILRKKINVYDRQVTVRQILLAIEKDIGEEGTIMWESIATGLVQEGRL